MQRIFEWLFFLLFGLSLGGFNTWAWQTQRAFVDGQQSVLSRSVNVGDDASPCSVEIPVSVLVEMVDIGVLDWHQLCEKDQPNDQ